MARQPKNAPKTLPVSVSDTELGNITQNNPNVVLSLQDRVIAALRDGMKSYINAGRLMRTAIESKYYESLGFKGSREWLATLPNSVADSYNMQSASKVADYAGVSDSYLAEVGKLAVYHIGRAMGEIEKKELRPALVALLGTIRGVDNVTAFKAIAEFKRANGLKLTDTDEKALFGPVPQGKPQKPDVNPEKPTDKKELTVTFRGIAFDDVVKSLVHAGIDVNDDKAVARKFAAWVAIMAAKIDEKMAEKTAVKTSKPETATASNDEVSAEDTAYMASDEARIQAMNAVN